MTEDVTYRELLMRLSGALAMTEAAYVEATAVSIKLDPYAIMGG